MLPTIDYIYCPCRSLPTKHSSIAECAQGTKTAAKALLSRYVPIPDDALEKMAMIASIEGDEDLGLLAELYRNANLIVKGYDNPFRCHMILEGKQVILEIYALQDEVNGGATSGPVKSDLTVDDNETDFLVSLNLPPLAFMQSLEKISGTLKQRMVVKFMRQLIAGVITENGYEFLLDNELLVNQVIHFYTEYLVTNVMPTSLITILTGCPPKSRPYYSNTNNIHVPKTHKHKKESKTITTYVAKSNSQTAESTDTSIEANSIRSYDAIYNAHNSKPYKKNTSKQNILNKQERRANDRALTTQPIDNYDDIRSYDVAYQSLFEGKYANKTIPIDFIFGSLTIHSTPGSGVLSKCCVMYALLLYMATVRELPLELNRNIRITLANLKKNTPSEKDRDELVIMFLALLSHFKCNLSTGQIAELTTGVAEPTFKHIISCLGVHVYEGYAEAGNEFLYRMISGQTRHLVYIAKTINIVSKKPTSLCAYDALSLMNTSRESFADAILQYREAYWPSADNFCSDIELVHYIIENNLTRSIYMPHYTQAKELIRLEFLYQNKSFKLDPTGVMYDINHYVRVAYPWLVERSYKMQDNSLYIFTDQNKLTIEELIATRPFVFTTFMDNYFNKKICKDDFYLGIMQMIYALNIGPAYRYLVNLLHSHEVVYKCFQKDTVKFSKIIAHLKEAEPSEVCLYNLDNGKYFCSIFNLIEANKECKFIPEDVMKDALLIERGKAEFMEIENTKVVLPRKLVDRPEQKTVPTEPKIDINKILSPLESILSVERFAALKLKLELFPQLTIRPRPINSDCPKALFKYENEPGLHMTVTPSGVSNIKLNFAFGPKAKAWLVKHYPAEMEYAEGENLMSSSYGHPFCRFIVNLFTIKIMDFLYKQGCNKWMFIADKPQFTVAASRTMDVLTLHTRPMISNYDFAFLNKTKANYKKLLLDEKLDQNFSLNIDFGIIATDVIYYPGVQDALENHVLKGGKAMITVMLMHSSPGVYKLYDGEGDYEVYLDENNKLMINFKPRDNDSSYQHPAFIWPYVEPKTAVSEKGVVYKVLDSVEIGPGTFNMLIELIPGLGDHNFRIIGTIPTKQLSTHDYDSAIEGKTLEYMVNLNQDAKELCDPQAAITNAIRYSSVTLGKNINEDNMLQYSNSVVRSIEKSKLLNQRMLDNIERYKLTEPDDPVKLIKKEVVLTLKAQLVSGLHLLQSTNMMAGFQTCFLIGEFSRLISRLISMPKISTRFAGTMHRLNILRQESLLRDKRHKFTLLKNALFSLDIIMHIYLFFRDKHKSSKKVLFLKLLGILVQFGGNLFVYYKQWKDKLILKNKINNAYIQDLRVSTVNPDIGYNFNDIRVDPRTLHNPIIQDLRETKFDLIEPPTPEIESDKIPNTYPTVRVEPNNLKKEEVPKQPTTSGPRIVDLLTGVTNDGRNMNLNQKLDNKPFNIQMSRIANGIGHKFEEALMVQGMEVSRPVKNLLDRGIYVSDPQMYGDMDNIINDKLKVNKNYSLPNAINYSKKAPLVFQDTSPIDAEVLFERFHGDHATSTSVVNVGTESRIRALLGRQLSHFLKPEKRYVEMCYQEALNIAAKLKPALQLSKNINYKNAFNKSGPAKYKKYIRGYKKLLSGYRLTSKSTIFSKVFEKACVLHEPEYDKYVGLNNKRAIIKPRMIVAPNEMYQAVTILMNDVLLNCVKKTMGDNIGLGLNSEQLADKLTYMNKRIKNNIMVMVDCQNYDSTQDISLKTAIDNVILEELFPFIFQKTGIPANYYDVVKKVLMDQNIDFTISDQKGVLILLKGLIEGTTGSGKTCDTTTFNTIRSIIYHRLVCKLGNIPETAEAFIFAGDDVFGFLDKEYVEQYKLAFWKLFNKPQNITQEEFNDRLINSRGDVSSIIKQTGLGLIAKMLQVQDNLGEFLSKHILRGPNSTIFVTRQANRLYNTGMASDKIKKLTISRAQLNFVIQSQLLKEDPTNPLYKFLIETRQKKLRFDHHSNKKLKKFKLEHYQELKHRGHTNRRINHDNLLPYWNAAYGIGVLDLLTNESTVVKGLRCMRERINNLNIAKLW